MTTTRFTLGDEEPLGHVVFMGEYRFPDGDAAAVRTLSLARICRDLGYSVTVIGKGALRAEHYDRALDAHMIEGIRYATMNPGPVSARERVLHPLRRLGLYVSTFRAMKLPDVRAIIIYASSSALHVPLVRSYCLQRRIPLIADVCEWYAPRQMRFGRLNPTYAMFRHVFRRILPRMRNLIVVSSLLERRFQGVGRSVLRVPPVVDTRRVAVVDASPTDRLVLLYAGTPGRKDHLSEMLVALASLEPDERSRIEFRVLGPTAEELRVLLGASASLLDALADTVRLLGRVPHARVLEELQQAHFTVLLRPDARYAHAGFPSKVSESLSAGVPLLLTFTSDLRDYLGDGEAALAVESCSATAVAATLRRALQLDPAALGAMRRAARAKAELHFDYRTYLASFGAFLERAC